jgi:hypothetical protein
LPEPTTGRVIVCKLLVGAVEVDNELYTRFRIWGVNYASYETGKTQAVVFILYLKTC